MRVLYFTPGHAPELADAEHDAVAGGFYWLDVERSEENWHDQAERWLGVRLHDRHIQDTLNETHPPYFDSTDDYDLLIVRTMYPDSPPDYPTTSPISFIVSGNAVVSVRAQNDPVFVKLHQRFLGSPRHVPVSTAMLLQQLLDQVTDMLLLRRDTTSELLTGWQEHLLDRQLPFDDWRALLRLHGQLRRLAVATESQLDVIYAWREQTALAIDGSLAVRFNDLQEHLRRVYDHAIDVQKDIDALVQIYFSINSRRTNEILRILTIVSVLFLPLNLLAGVFGMNFVHLPLLRSEWGPWAVTGMMMVTVGGLLTWFRHRRWI